MKHLYRRKLALFFVSLVHMPMATRITHGISIDFKPDVMYTFRGHSASSSCSLLFLLLLLVFFIVLSCPSLSRLCFTEQIKMKRHSTDAHVGNYKEKTSSRIDLFDEGGIEFESMYQTHRLLIFRTFLIRSYQPDGHTVLFTDNDEWILPQQQRQ